MIGSRKLIPVYPTRAQTQATLLRSIARQHRDQGNRRYAEALERQAQALDPLPDPPPPPPPDTEDGDYREEPE